MTDIVDKANDTLECWLNNQITHARIQAEPNDINECEDCGKSIGAARKRAMPSAIRCTVCQSLYEKRKT